MIYPRRVQKLNILTEDAWRSLKVTTVVDVDGRPESGMIS